MKSIKEKNTPIKREHPERPALFVDMDGTLAEWKPIAIPVQIPTQKIKDYINDRLYTKDYFKTLRPYENVVNAIRNLIKEGEFEVYILSCVLPENEKYPNSHPAQDKSAWLKKYLPEIDSFHQIFVPDGEPKVYNIPFTLTNQDALIDDYTKNLQAWEQDAKHLYQAKVTGIKLQNIINDTNRTFEGARISILHDAHQIQNRIYQALDIIPEYLKDTEIEQDEIDY